MITPLRRVSATTYQEMQMVLDLLVTTVFLNPVQVQRAGVSLDAVNNLLAVAYISRCNITATIRLPRSGKRDLAAAFVAIPDAV